MARTTFTLTTLSRSLHLDRLGFSPPLTSPLKFQPSREPILRCNEIHFNKDISSALFNANVYGGKSRCQDGLKTALSIDPRTERPSLRENCRLGKLDPYSANCKRSLSRRTSSGSDN